MEVVLVAMVSVWLGRQEAGPSMAASLKPLAMGALALAAVFWLGGHWILPSFERFMPRHAYHLVTVSMFVLFGFVGLTMVAGLGSVLGAVAAGLVMQPTYAHLGLLGQRAGQAFRQIAFGFFGALFFLHVGLKVDLAGVASAPGLTLVLFLAAALGKIIGVLPFAITRRMSFVEALVVGVGLDARLTTEIIVAQLLFRAGRIPSSLFDALVAASALATLCVPLAFSLLMRRWGALLVASAR